MVLGNNNQNALLRKEQVNWKKYRENLLASLSNERLWAMGCDDVYNCHFQNVAELEEELESVDNACYELVLSKYGDAPEHFEDFLL